MGSAEDSGRYSTPEELRCLPFGTQAVLIWRGEKNRGDHLSLFLLSLVRESSEILRFAQNDTEY